MKAASEQPRPRQDQTGPCVQDLVIADLITTLGVTDHPVMRDLEARKQVGLERYGTLLYPDNGRDSVLDAYQEALDLCVYLKQAQCEGKGLESAYRTALLLACDLRESLR